MLLLLLFVVAVDFVVSVSFARYSPLKWTRLCRVWSKKIDRNKERNKEKGRGKEKREKGKEKERKRKESNEVWDMHLFIFMRMYIYLCARTKWKGGRKVNKGNWRVFVCLFVCVFVCFCMYV